jgi:hypothetical protein
MLGYEAFQWQIDQEKADEQENLKSVAVCLAGAATCNISTSE